MSLRGAISHGFTTLVGVGFSFYFITLKRDAFPWLTEKVQMAGAWGAERIQFVTNISLQPQYVGLGMFAVGCAAVCGFLGTFLYRSS